jgi:OmpA-OmpF porin, OOP family
MIFDEKVLFDFDKSTLKPSGKEALKGYLKEARAHLKSARTVKITGYTDNVGSKNYNVKLSQRRAKAVSDYLVKLGADAKKMKVSGKGEAGPIADNRTKEGRAKNRRVEIEVVGLGK